MTNATVETVMSIKYKDVEKKVFVPANVPIVTSAPSDKAALTAGAHVVLNATKGSDGTLTTTSVQIGKDGLTPPT